MRCSQYRSHSLYTERSTTNTSAITISNEHLPLKNKMRKLIMEKMQRDQINSSIEQLKSLLAPEFFNQQPDSNLKKQQQQQPAFSYSSAATNQRFSGGVHEIVHFLSKEEVKTQSQRKLLKHFQNIQPSSDKNRRERFLAHLSSTEQQIISKENN